MSRINLKRAAMLLLLALLLSVSGATPALAQEDGQSPNPVCVEAIYRAATDALNAGDAEGNMAFYAQDAISVALPPPPGSTGITVGYDAMLEATKEFVSRNLHTEFLDFHANGDSATFTGLLTEDVFTDLGVAPIEFSGTTTVQNGKIILETFVMRPESFAKFMAAVAAADNKALVQRLYDEVYTSGTTDVLAELVAPDALADYQASVAETQAAYPELTATVEKLLVEGDQVVAVLTFTGTPAGGEPVTWSQVDIHSLADGLLAETSHFGGPPTAGE